MFITLSCGGDVLPSWVDERRSVTIHHRVTIDESDLGGNNRAELLGVGRLVENA